MCFKCLEGNKTAFIPFVLRKGSAEGHPSGHQHQQTQQRLEGINGRPAAPRPNLLNSYELLKMQNQDRSQTRNQGHVETSSAAFYTNQGMLLNNNQYRAPALKSEYQQHRPQRGALPLHSGPLRGSRDPSPAANVTHGMNELVLGAPAPQEEQISDYQAAQQKRYRSQAGANGTLRNTRARQKAGADPQHDGKGTEVILVSKIQPNIFFTHHYFLMDT